LLTFSCSLGGHWSSEGGGWVEFVSMAAFTATMVWFMMHMVNAVPPVLLAKPAVSYQIYRALHYEQTARTAEVHTKQTKLAITKGLNLVVEIT
jgi:hypothetical protein